MIIEEGKGKFIKPEKKGLFYNPRGKLSRELGIAILRAEKEIKNDISVFECMAGIGFRTIRYYLEANIKNIWANEANEEAIKILEENLKLNSINDVKITNFEAKKILLENALNGNRFDFIDLDSFGSPSEFIFSVIMALKLEGVIYFTSTDGFTLCGLKQKASIRNYGVHSINSKFCHELGARILISTFMKIAGNLNMHFEPLISLFDGYSWRIALRLKRGVENANFDKFGYVLYEPTTKAFKIFKDNHIEGKGLVSGPVYLGEIHQKHYIDKLIEVSKEFDDLRKILEKIKNEENGPFFYDYQEICDVISVSPPPRKKIIKKLKNLGYLVSETHFSPYGIKTNANYEEFVKVLKMLVEKN
ncbi:MAG: hypothetical protein ABIL76_00855 [candidate division WOR-3 bacterium]